MLGKDNECSVKTMNATYVGCFMTQKTQEDCIPITSSREVQAEEEQQVRSMD